MDVEHVSHQGINRPGLLQFADVELAVIQNYRLVGGLKTEVGIPGAPRPQDGGRQNGHNDGAAENTVSLKFTAQMDSLSP